MGCKKLKIRKKGKIIFSYLLFPFSYSLLLPQRAYFYKYEMLPNKSLFVWGMGNWEWKKGSEHFLLVINNPFLFTSDLEML